MKRIFLTYCSADKDDSLRGTSKRVTPDKLYTSPRIQGFIKACIANGVDWAIFSDQYGIVFPWETIKWYEKPPDSVSETEYQELLKNLILKLSSYDEVRFYYQPAGFHKLYKRITEDAKQQGCKITFSAHLFDVKQ